MTGLPERSTSKELGVGDSEVVGFGIGVSGSESPWSKKKKKKNN